MGERKKSIIAILTALAMLIGMCSCSNSDAASDEVFAGKLIDAQGDRIVVRGTEETILFVTGDGTIYELQDETSLCVGDEIEVGYHRGKETFIADTVRLTAHKEQSMVFGGQVMELEDNFLTVRSESLTAGFEYDEETKLNGNLSKGDTVTITYDGDLSQSPHAISIVVAQEGQEKALKSIHGTVSETRKHSVLISMDSADACRFVTSADTIINGDDTKLKIGDDVDVVYTGTIGEKPVARAITIRRDEARDFYVMDGVITKIRPHKLVIQTKKKSYTFKINDETRIQDADNMIWGHLVTITYTGNLNDKPVAASICCSKETVNIKEKSKKKPKKEKQKEPTKAGKEAKPAKAAKPKSKPEPKTDDLIVNIKGVISEWDNPCVIKVEGGGTVELDISDSSIAGGYVPQEGDQVIAAYEKDDMKLLHLQLEYRPSPDQIEQDDDADEPEDLQKLVKQQKKQNKKQKTKKTHKKQKNHKQKKQKRSKKHKKTGKGSDEEDDD